jgi:hypothetical protein
MTIEEELLTATKVPQKGKTESRSKYLARLCRAVSDLDDGEWAKITKPAQRWANKAIEAMTEHQDIKDFPENCPEEKDAPPPAASFTEDEALEEVAEDTAPKDAKEEDDDEDEEESPAVPDTELDEPEEVVAEPPKKRGRPKKVETVEAPAPKKRGRPKKPAPVAKEAPKKIEVKEEAPEPKKAPVAKPEEDDDERRHFVIKSRRSSKPGSTDFFRELCIDNPKWDRDALMAKAAKSGYPIRPGTANVIYYEIKRVLEILANKKLIDFGIEER